MNSSHPKLSWTAWGRDVLRCVLTTLALMACLVLGGLLCLAAWLYVHPFPMLVEAKVERAQMDLRVIRKLLKQHHTTHQRYPTTAEGFQPLVDAGLLERLPVDPWGNPYGYTLHPWGPVLWTLGADGLSGGEEEDADLFSEG